MNLRVLLNCGEADGVLRAAVAWQPQPAIKTYQLYRLGNQYLEPLRQTSDTVAFLTPADGFYVAVAPVLNGAPALPSFLIDYRRQGVGCYVVNWLAHLPVADTAQLDLTLSTTWNLKAITLERATQTGFVALQTIQPAANQLIYTFTDRPVTAGPARYRLRLTTTANETVLTGEETVYIINPPEPLIFPNPVVAGEPVSVLMADSEAVGVWFTADGRRGSSVPLSAASSKCQRPLCGPVCTCFNLVRLLVRYVQRKYWCGRRGSNESVKQKTPAVGPGLVLLFCLRITSTISTGIVGLYGRCC